METSGRLRPLVFPVSRQRNGRLGYLLLQVFEVDEPKIRVLVNRGWVPRDTLDFYKEQVQKDVGPTAFKALLKKGEQVEVREKQLGFFRQATELQLVDLETIAKQVDGGVNTDVFLEEFVTDSDSSQTLYPARSSRWSYTAPYLTPQKHLEYSVFWGSAAVIGVWGAVRSLKTR